MLWKRKEKKKSLLKEIAVEEFVVFTISKFLNAYFIIQKLPNLEAPSKHAGLQ